MNHCDILICLKRSEFASTMQSYWKKTKIGHNFGTKKICTHFQDLKVWKLPYEGTQTILSDRLKGLVECCIEG